MEGEVNSVQAVGLKKAIDQIRALLKRGRDVPRCEAQELFAEHADAILNAAEIGNQATCEHGMMLMVLPPICGHCGKRFR